MIGFGQHRDAGTYEGTAHPRPGARKHDELKEELVSGVHDRLVDELNDFMQDLVDEGEFDLASKLFDILEEHDLLREEGDDYPEDDDE